MYNVPRKLSVCEGDQVVMMNAAVYAMSMNETGIKEIVIKEIIELAQKHGLEKVILFGSRARGDYHRASDIDLAVYGGNVTGFSLDVEENTSTLLTYDIVDMKKVNKPAFVDAIKEEGKILYEKV